MKRWISVMIPAVMAFIVLGVAAPTFAEDPAQTYQTPGTASISGQVYSNDTIHLRCEVPENWTQYTQSEIADGGSPEEGFRTDMYAKGSGNDSLSVMIQRLSIEELSVLDEYPVSELGAMQENAVVSMLEAAGGQNVLFLVDEGFSSFPADDYGCIFVSSDMNGNTIYMRQVFYRVGEYMVSVTAASHGTDSTAEYLGWFDAA